MRTDAQIKFLYYPVNDDEKRAEDKEEQDQQTVGL